MPNDEPAAPPPLTEWEKLGDAEGTSAAKAGDLENFGKGLLPAEVYILPWRELPGEIAKTVEEDLGKNGETSRYWGIDKKSYARAWLKSVKRSSED
jgi:hypothetical protein